MKSRRLILETNQKIITKKGIETKWTFLCDVEYKQYGKTIRRIVKVQCDCGKIKEVQLNNIIAGHSICCGISPCKTAYNKNKRSLETTYNSLFYAYKKGASDRNLNFELSKEEFKEFLNKNCFYCGEPPSNLYQIKNSKTGEIRAGIPLLYNGIDRLDNKIGYTIENSITCCDMCNKMKRSYEFTNFLEQIKKIYRHKFGDLI